MGGFEIILFCKGREFCRSERQFGCMVKINRVIRSSPLRFQRNGKVKLTAVYIPATVLNMSGIRHLFLRRYIVN
ncbi:MAG: hypothetical protein LUQ04_08675 [Methanoregula sp.]|nr:hypothetical protein [Methanoregula sp.]